MGSKPLLPMQAYLVASGVFALDRLTKWVIETRVSEFETHTVIPGFFDIVHARNRGAAFSFLADVNSPWRDAFLIVVSMGALIVVASMLRKTEQLDRATTWALTLILGGALGNVFDRLVFGSVTDFLDFYVGAAHWPAFNVADSAIVCGSGLLLLGLLKSKSQPAQT